MEIDWREPPEAEFKRGRTSGRVKAFVEILKENPGRWAAYRSVPKEDAKKMNGTAAYMKHHYKLEVTVRIEDDETTVTLFARWPKPKRGRPRK
jgi:hypothetical protein